MANGLPASQARVLAATHRPLTSIALAQNPGMECHSGEVGGCMVRIGTVSLCALSDK